MSYVTKNLGRYNLASYEKEWCVQLRLPNGKWLSEKWSEDDEPELDANTPPSEAVEAISKRLESYLFHSDRNVKRELIAYARTVANQMDREWAQRRIETAQREIERMESLISDLSEDEAA